MQTHCAGCRRSEEAREAEQQRRRDRAAAGTAAFRASLAEQVLARKAEREAAQQQRKAEAAAEAVTLEARPAMLGHAGSDC